MARRVETEECVHCGHVFRAGRPACPECGSDASTGWRDAEDIDYLSVELPDETATTESARSVRPWWLLALIAALVAALAVAVSLHR